MPHYPFDPDAAIRHLRSAEPAFCAVHDAYGDFAMRYEPLDSVFHALLRSIVYQQLSGKAAGSIFGRVEALFDGQPSASGLATLCDDQLRSAGMSGAKTRAVRSLAEHVLDGSCPSVDELHDLTDQEIRDRLTVIRGIGSWTVDMLLIFRLGRPDVMPANDLGIRKGYARMRGLEEMPSPKELERLTEAWRPWRTVGSWYMWRALEIDLPDGS
jgi:3-methyladenine DNA glycosylase/8-oxoguanine DNA glycosylase